MEQPKLWDLEGRVVLITGGARGIGRASAELCGSRGASVVIADILDSGHETARILNEQGIDSSFCRVDVRDPEQVKQLIDAIEERYGRLDAVVCAAGVLKGPFLQPEEFPLDDFEIIMDVNVKGVFLTAKYATPLLERSGHGVFVIVGSPAGTKGPSSSLGYGASKGGVNGLGMTLENHLGQRNIRVNVICPGNIVTEMKLSVEVAAAMQTGKPVEEALAEARRKYGTPDGVARVIAFLVSDEAEYVRGTLFTR